MPDESNERIVDRNPEIIPDDLSHEPLLPVLGAGAALVAALRSGNTQHAVAAEEQWNKATEGLDLPEPDLRAVKSNAIVAAAAGAATDDDLAAVEDNIDQDPYPALASQVEGELADRDLAAVAAENTARAKGEEAELQASDEENAEAREDDGPDATEAAQAKAEELGVDLSEVEGSGKDGRIVASDVKAEGDA